MNAIQKSSIENKFFVLNLQNADLFYIVNSGIGTCTYPIGITGALCKHQGAVLVKFHILMFNFLPSLISKECMIYAYITLGEYICFIY